MNREQKSGKEYSKHISMELTADAARVTNLSLVGSRLVLTIEAELAESNLRSTDDDGESRHLINRAAMASADDTQIVRHPHSADANALGLADPGNAEPSTMALGSESLAPPAAAHTPSVVDTSSHPAVAYQTPPPPTTTDSTRTMIPDEVFLSRGSEPEYFGALPPPLPDPEPERDLTDTWETPLPGSNRLTPPPLPPLPEADLPLTPPPLPPQPEPATETPIPEPWQPPELHDTSEPHEVPPPFPDFGQDQLAVSEESSAIGGARHGEPQPTISFGPETQELATPSYPSIDTTTAEFPAVVEETSLRPDEVKMAAPTSEPLKLDPPKPDTDKPEGGTTVLIRYTCPKCKTQGMQAVDKVGTVVNCSNCGKAMRLVMKK